MCGIAGIVYTDRAHPVDRELVRRLRRERGIHVNPWTHFPRLITSIDYLKSEAPLRRFREALPGPDEPRYPRRYDLLIVDEAHNAAPAGRGRYATDSLRTSLLRELVPHFEHRLFLTATPHNGYLESFTALLELLDCVLADRLEHPVARACRRVALAQEALVQERLQGVGIGFRDVFSSLVGAAAAEDGEAAKEALLLF